MGKQVVVMKARVKAKKRVVAKTQRTFAIEFSDKNVQEESGLKKDQS